jgi:hypothetical protein
MPSDEPAKSRRSDPAFNPFDSALRDSAIILDAYARFATTLIGTLLFPYAAARPAASTSQPNDVRSPQRSRSHAIVNVGIAFLIGVVLGRRVLARRGASRQT